MKKLTIEEKAKRYDEAIKIAKDINDEQRAQPFNVMIKVFPELEGSEDEKVRKELLLDIPKVFPHDKAFRYIAYLEKQGEQKHADKVEPKFHEGDWILNNVCFPVQIASIEGDMYRFTDGDALSSSFVDENYHLWSIQDAEDGDVLMSESNCGLGTWYCIFKSLDDNESMTVYCYLARDGRFEAKKELCFDKDPFNTKPATKEQCDLLFQKMKEAGYEWDAYKKELKKIEQKPAEWSEDDEQYLLVCKNALRKYEVTDKWDSNIISQWLDNKLRCLRPQEQWKPTKEQLETFDYYLDADISNKDKEILFGLYNDLKQL